MRILNTSGNHLLAEFNRKLAAIPASQYPPASCLVLFRRILGHLTHLTHALGMPTFQMFGSKPFEYAGFRYGADMTWTHPNGTIDGVNTSFLASDDGTCFQFILFDHLHGTIFERRFLANGAMEKELVALAGMAVGYCSTARP